MKSKTAGQSFLSACALTAVAAAGILLAPAEGRRAIADPRSLAAPAPGDGIVYQSWHDQTRNRYIPVKLYMPKSGTAPYPVVIFSHGLGGSREAAGYLGDYWSQHGYLGVFVQHAGSDTSVWQDSMGSGREAIMKRMRMAANAANLIDRANDIKFVIDELEHRNQNDSLLKGKIDLQEIALGGHSFGAGTTLTIAGERFAGRTLEDPRVKSALYLCPPIMGGKQAPDQTYGAIKIPGMLLTGTEDDSPINDTKAADRRIPFDGIRAPHQYLVNFNGADHATFGGRSFRPAKDSDERFHKMIEQVTTEFLDATLKNDRNAWHWLDSKEAVAYLGSAAVYERK
ncbi:MAG TPA: hypothetical protein V6C72_15965 [Chroococcales cyanobacterium]